MRFIIIVLSIMTLVGCMKHNVQVYSAVDHSNKTVTVPAGAKGLKGEIKKLLSQQGWKLSVYRGPSVTEGSFGKKTKLEKYDTFNTRYRLIVVSRQYDLCLNFTPAITYEVSFIDNHSGAEVFTIDGRGCESGAVEEFKKAFSGL